MEDDTRVARAVYSSRTARRWSWEDTTAVVWIGGDEEEWRVGRGESIEMLEAVEERDGEAAYGR